MPDGPFRIFVKRVDLMCIDQLGLTNTTTCAIEAHIYGPRYCPFTAGSSVFPTGIH